jgi:hypothetical protein
LVVLSSQLVAGIQQKFLKGVNSECKADGECYFGSYCLEGKCVKYSKQGEACDARKCAPYMICSPNETPKGALASSTEEEDLMRRSTNGVCNYRYPNEEGKTCTFSRDCGSDLFCSSVGVCIKRIVENGACDQDGCVNDLKCLVPGGSREGKCVKRLISLGEKCGVYADWAPKCSSKRDEK